MPQNVSPHCSCNGTDEKKFIATYITIFFACKRGTNPQTDNISADVCGENLQVALLLLNKFNN